MTTKQERGVLASIKEKFLRTLADFKHTASSLMEIFGMAIRAKLEGANRLGKHFLNAHGPGHLARSHKHNPAGTKLIRSFIRRGNTENVYYRKMYAELTGHQYQGVEE